MDEKYAIELLVDKYVADEVTKKGIAEIALRRTDAKFKDIVKCSIIGKSTEPESSTTKVVSAALDIVDPHYSYEDFRSAMSKIKNELNKSANSLKKMSSDTKKMAENVDIIYHNTDIVKTLSYLNIGLSLANVAIDVAGFIIIDNKLNYLNESIIGVSAKAEKLLAIEKNKIVQKCQELVMKYKSMAEKIKDGENIELDSIDGLLIEMCSYISAMISNLLEETSNKELLLDIIFTLTPAYTMLLSEFVKRYYFSKGKLPPNYDSFIRLYDELAAEQIEIILEDYYFLDKKMDRLDTLDAVNAQILLALNGRLLVEDQRDLVKAIGNQENYLLFHDEIEKIATERIKNMIPAIADKSEVSSKECRKLLKPLQ